MTKFIKSNLVIIVRYLFNDTLDYLQNRLLKVEHLFTPNTPL